MSQGERRLLPFKAVPGLAAVGLAVLSVVAAAAEEGRKPGAEKWRPKDGVYASRGAMFIDRCADFGDVIVQFSEKTITGGEQVCKITKLTDTAQDVITLEVSCTEGDEKKKPVKEMMSLKKVDDKTIVFRESQNGKFGRPGIEVSYCPDDVQRIYIEQNTKRVTEAPPWPRRADSGLSAIQQR